MPNDPVALIRREERAYGRFIAHTAAGSQTDLELRFYMGWIACALERYQSLVSLARHTQPPQGEPS